MTEHEWDAEAVRAASLAALAPYGFAPAALPLLAAEEVARLRPVGDVVARAQAMYGVAAVSDGADRELVVGSLEARGLTPWLSDRERAFVAGWADEGERIEMSWRVEALMALGWALRLVAELPLTGAEPAPAEAYDPLDPQGPRGIADSAIELRPATEIATRLDLFYCAHWAVREHQLTNRFDPWPEELVPGAVWERRHGLEWLFAEPGVDWDEIDLST